MDLVRISAKQYELDWLKVQITRRCNLSCHFCSQADWRSKEVLDVPQFLERVLSKADVRLLIITGGEPLTVLDELETLLEYCQSRGIETGIFSNGTLATPEIAQNLRAAGLAWIRVSLNGSSSAVHETSYPQGSFERTLSGIANCLKEGVKVKVRSTVSKGNLKDVPDLVSFVSSLGVSELDFRPYLPLGDCNPHDQFVLCPEELLQTGGMLTALGKVHPGLRVRLLPGWFDFISAGPEGESFEECHCGRHYLYIDVNGNFMPCAGHRMKVGQMKRDSLEETWKHAPGLDLMRAYEQAEYCQGCPSQEQCHRSSCSLVNFEANGSFSAVNPLCPVVRLDPADAVSGHARAQSLFDNARVEAYDRYSTD